MFTIVPHNLSNRFRVVPKMIKSGALLVFLFGVLLVDIGTSYYHGYGEANETFAAFKPHNMKAEEYHPQYHHKAIIGSAKEVEKFYSLSPEDAKRRLSLMVIQMDKNADGVVDQGELKFWIIKSLENLLEEDATNRFEAIDRNNDDVITWEEYSTEELTNLLESNTSKEVQERRLTDDKELFEAADDNKDGKLDYDEFVQFLSPDEFPHKFTDVIVKQLLRHADTNRDGKIDFQEFVAENSESHEEHWLENEKKIFMQHFDENGDGFLNIPELLSFVIINHDQIAETKVAELLKLVDEDNDGYLSYEEIMEKYDIFVGRKAIDNEEDYDDDDVDDDPSIYHIYDVL